MDKNEFRARIEQYAQVKDVLPTALPTPRGSGRPKGRPRLDDIRYETSDVNPTLGFRIVKMHERTSECRMGCGEQVSNQVVEYRYSERPYPHWKTRCENCHNHINPSGTGFCRGTNVTNEYARYFRANPGADFRINPWGIDK